MKHRHLALVMAAVAAAGAWTWISLGRQAPALARAAPPPMSSGRALGSTHLAIPSQPVDPAHEGAPEISGVGPAAGTPARRVEIDEGVLHGRVIDAKTRTPLDHAAFHVGQRSTSVDESGRFRLTDVTEGLPFVVEAEGYCYLRGHIGAWETAETETIVYPLVASSPVEGRVVDIDGFAVARAFVSVVPVDEETGIHDEPWSVRPASAWRMVAEAFGGWDHTDEDGSFALDGFIPGSGGLAIRVAKTGFHTRIRPVTGGAPGRVARHEVVLRRHLGHRGELAGRVTINGEPAEARLWVCDGSEPEDWTGTVALGRSDPLSMGGFYRIGHVPVGEVQVRVAPATWDLVAPDVALDFPGASATASIAAGERTWQDFHLSIATRAISGRVIGRSDESTAGLTVMAQTVNELNFVTETAADGRYRIELPEIGHPYRLRCTSSPFERDGDVRPGDEVDIVMPDRRPVVILASDAGTGRALSSVHVAIRRPEGSGKWVYVDARPTPDGHRFDAPIGVLDVRVSRGGYEEGIRRSVEVHDGERRTVIAIELAEIER